MTLKGNTTKVGATLKNGGGLLEMLTRQTEGFGLYTTDLKTKEKRRRNMSNHVFLKADIGFKILDADECDHFEGTIGALNEVLEENFNCVICYDEDEDEDTSETIYNGFAIQAKGGSDE